MSKYSYRYSLEMRDGVSIASLIMTNQDTGKEKTLWTQSYHGNNVFLRITETSNSGGHGFHVHRMGNWLEQAPSFQLPFDGPELPELTESSPEASSSAQ